MSSVRIFFAFFLVVFLVQCSHPRKAFVIHYLNGHRKIVIKDDKVLKDKGKAHFCMPLPKIKVKCDDTYTILNDTLFIKYCFHFSDEEPRVDTLRMGKGEGKDTLFISRDFYYLETKGLKRVFPGIFW